MGVFESSKTESVSRQLLVSHTQIHFADFAWEPSGALLVTLSTGIVKQPIRFVRIEIAKKNPFEMENRARTTHEIEMRTYQIQSLFIPSENIAQEFSAADIFITHLQFPHKEYSDQIIIRYY